MIFFVHCWGCRLPSSPSGRRVYVDGMEARDSAAVLACHSVARMRREERIREQMRVLDKGPCPDAVKVLPPALREELAAAAISWPSLGTL